MGLRIKESRRWLVSQFILDSSIMQFFVLLSVAATAFAAPAPQESPAAEPYVHEETVETAAIAAEPYVHAEIAAEPYLHVEPVAAAAPVVTAPVAYAGYPYGYAGYPYAAGHVAYAGYPHVAYAAYPTGCVNSVGSVVPCAQ